MNNYKTHFKVVIVLVIAILLTVFTILNSNIVSLNLGFKTFEVSLALVIVCSVLLGVVLMNLITFITMIRKKAKEKAEFKASFEEYKKQTEECKKKSSEKKKDFSNKDTKLKYSKNIDDKNIDDKNVDFETKKEKSEIKIDNSENSEIDLGKKETSSISDKKDDLVESEKSKDETKKRKFFRFKKTKSKDEDEKDNDLDDSTDKVDENK